ETVGRSIDELIVPPEKRAEARTAIEDTIRDGSVVFETVRRRKDGALIHVDVSKRRVDMPGGDTFIAVSKKDVTPRADGKAVRVHERRAYRAARRAVRP